MENTSVELLYQDCRNGKREAQETLYKLTAPKMLGICLRYANTTFEAEDILQMGYIKVFTRIGDFKGKGSFEGWIRRVMVNTAITNFRKTKKDRETLEIDELEKHNPGAYKVEMDQLEYSDLLKLIQKLPEGFRMVFNLYIMEGYSHKEIAEMLGIQESTSKSQLSRAREWLKTKINGWEDHSYA